MVCKELRSIKTKYSNKIEMNLNTLLATEKKILKKLTKGLPLTGSVSPTHSLKRIRIQNYTTE